MKLTDLKSAAQLAKKYGVKSIIFGAPGSGKTPLVASAPRPVLLATEPGLLSIRHVQNVPVWEAYTAPKIDEFLTWFFKSNETKNFDTLAIDSLSNMAELFLKAELERHKHGMQAYGALSQRVMAVCDELFYLQDKHVVMLAKEGTRENGSSVVMANGVAEQVPILQKIPFFPGKDLNVKIPHLFDNVLHLDTVSITGMPGKHLALRTAKTERVFSRSRCGVFAEFEPPNLTDLFNKSFS